MRKSIKRRTAAATLASALAVTLAAGAGSPVAAADNPDRARAATPVNSSGAHTVTLITGDQVRLDEDGEVVGLLPADGRERIPVQLLQGEEHSYVIPQDAAQLVHRGVVDRRLFDVKELSRPEYRRAHQDKLPFIVRYEKGQGAQPRLHEAVDLTVRRTLTSMAAEALAGAPEQTAAAWQTLTRANEAGLRTAAAGVRSIWLDGRVKANLDQSVAQIGAPDAWDAGFDGTGTTIAVLDTGIDNSHPDLAGTKVVAEENFSTAADAKDHNGHGTHVASTAAGTGVKSGGKFQGVAPGAELINGKVLDDSGYGDESGIIDGMEWAVAEQGAEIVNLSLGGTDTPGVDLMEETVNVLSGEHDTLFVIAAGNSGPGKRSVDSPGSADAALTVGAVDDADQLADFSSIGPRVGDGAVKPDLTAPGVDIAAALSEGSALADEVEPVEDGYAAISGTSMATPHVAGSAALLRQQHPDWSGAQIKAALTGSALPGDYSAFQQGAGRVSVTGAIEQSVVAEPVSLNFGTAAWPHEDDEPVTKELTYRNLGSEDVTLALSLEGSAPDGELAPEGMFTLGAEEVTVPAGGTASVEATADPRLGGDQNGSYSVAVTATGGGQTVRTAGGLDREAESYELTVEAAGRDGEVPGDWNTLVFDFENGDFLPISGEDGTATVRLPKGTYTLETTLTGTDETGELITGVDWLVQPAFELTEDSTVEFDARQAEPIDLTVPDETATPQYLVVDYGVVVGESTFSSSWLTDPLADGFHTQHLGPELPAEQVHAQVLGSWQTEEGTSYQLAYGQDSSFFTGLTKQPAAEELAEVTLRQGASVEGRQGVLYTRADTGGFGGGWSVGTALDIPTTTTQYVNAEGVLWHHEFEQLGPEEEYEAWYYSPEGAEYTAGESYVETFNVGVFGPRLSADDGVFRTGNTLHGTVNPLADGAGHLGGGNYDSASTTLYRDGEEYQSAEDVLDFVEFTLEPDEAEYELVTTLTRSGVASVSTTVTAAYTFTSGFASEDEPVALPVSAVRFSPELALDSTAQAGTALDIPVTVEGAAAGENLGELTVSVSFDGGETWAELPVTDGQVTVENPAEAGTGVSLRAVATDSDGNQLTQTIVDAYRTS